MPDAEDVHVFAADGVCGPSNLAMVRSLGADRVIDYTREDFTRDARRYDVILDNVENRSLADCRRALTPSGTHPLPETPVALAHLETGHARGMTVITP